MKVYRAGEKQKKSDKAYKEVDYIDLPNDLNSWTLEKKVEGISISIEGINISKDANEKLSVVKIVFTEKDIIVLNERVIKGLQEKLSDNKNLQVENDKLKKDIWSLWKARNAAGSALRTAKRNGASKSELDNLESIVSVIDSIKQK